MTFPLWNPLPTGVVLSELVGASLLLLPTSPGVRAVVASVQFPTEGGYPVSFAWVDALDARGVLTLPDGDAHDRLTRLKIGGSFDVIVIPPIAWRTQGERLRFSTALMVLGGLTAGAIPLATGTPVGAALAIPTAAAVAATLWWVLRRRAPTRIPLPGEHHLDGATLVDYAVARIGGERPEVMSGAEQRARITRRIDAVRAEYGRLASDIVYRIESPALFDAAVPTTNAFEVALARYATEGSGLEVDDLDALAADLEIRFSVAKDHAETVGMGHLPEAARADARRAVKAATLAAGAATDGERQAAMDQVIRILDSLALYYLPAPEQVRGKLTSSAETPATPAGDG